VILLQLSHLVCYIIFHGSNTTLEMIQFFDQCTVCWYVMACSHHVQISRYITLFSKSSEMLLLASVDEHHRLFLHVPNLYHENKFLFLPCASTLICFMCCEVVSMSLLNVTDIFYNYKKNTLTEQKRNWNDSTIQSQFKNCNHWRTRYITLSD